MAELVPIFYEVRPEWESLLRGFLLHLGPAGAGGQLSRFLALFFRKLRGAAETARSSDALFVLLHCFAHESELSKNMRAWQELS